MPRNNEYEQLGLLLARSLNVVPRELFHDVSNRESLLEEYLCDLIITYENGDDLTSWFKDHIESYKEAVGWEEEK